ncbi:hypothetical protein GCM10009567_18400 [Rothia amarae]
MSAVELPRVFTRAAPTISSVRFVKVATGEKRRWRQRGVKEPARSSLIGVTY